MPWRKASWRKGCSCRFPSARGTGATCCRRGCTVWRPAARWARTPSRASSSAPANGSRAARPRIYPARLLGLAKQGHEPVLALLVLLRRLGVGAVLLDREALRFDLDVHFFGI